MNEAVVIGAGPAGLMAAEMLVDAGHSTLVVDAMPTAGRKLLMAGKSGLNLTKDEPFVDFLCAYGAAEKWLQPCLTAFGNHEVGPWAQALGQDVFTGSSGRVFPKTMKASPLLRSWLARLDAKGVTFKNRWRWQGWNDGALEFITPDGRERLSPKATVLALGGASWARLGSDGSWAELLAARDVELSSFAPSNMGITLDWSPHMQRHFGAAIKNVTLTCGGKTIKGEFVISARGLEGSLIYGFSPAYRAREPLSLDLLPNISREEITARLAKVPKKNTASNALRKALKLDPAKIALLQEFRHPLPPLDRLGTDLKTLAVPYTGTAPLDQAISVAGGVCQTALNDQFMLNAIPGVFCAGEMLDWEAPTGGYLLTACLATGRAAGLGAAGYL